MTRIKICGLTRPQDAALAVEYGADYLGFVFANSPRRVTPARAREIIALVPGQVQRVGVFVDAGEKEILQVVEQAGLSMIQLHGDEPPELCRCLPLPVIKAFRVRDESIRNADILEVISVYGTEYILLEPYVPGKYGGTGQRADWALAARIVASFPEKRFFLAGGLNPDNAREAVRTVQPYALDASSGLEERPGIKSKEKIRQFFKVVRQ